ncbi:alpha/beta hydrolase-fold protein [Aquimarina sp. ERC-38]|uniref:alpha/beta hydrolase n=1 Tax=Aquimarina sp. ERC-38 TaxID=2949996 RepID=UPI002246C90F|nr:alpha/beta hydrolase-fold protein [Aquimarina sp. ERC-38]UZO82385.1 alpha/beta hydrolase-fold protein [Aquimarina sp. ERC-38]
MIKLRPFIVVILLLGIASCIQKEKDQVPKNTNTTKPNQGIQIGQFDSLYSKILNQERKLIIYLPESFKDLSKKREKYPVVYLLDGSYNFILLVGMLKQYSEKNEKILPEMIVVGIENIDFKSRRMDFSPTTNGNPKEFGGGEKFLSFLEKELFPYIEKNYAGSGNRTIIGHSFGGLVVMNALTNHSEMFTNYLMIDGSLYFDDELFLKNSEYSLKGKDLKDKNLYIGIANTATYGSSLQSVRKDTIGANRYVRHSLELVNQINKMNTNLNMKCKYYKNDTHGSSAFLSQLDGLRFFYSWFEFKKEQKYRHKYFVPKTQDERFANLTKSHYDNVSKKLGYTFKPERDWLSKYAYSLNSFQNQPEQAIETYKLNINYYPKTSKVYEDLADFYLLLKDTANAALYNHKALNIKNNTSTDEMVIE